MSVTRLLSRTLEKIVVRNWLLPAIPNEWVCDRAHLLTMLLPRLNIVNMCLACLLIFSSI